MGKRKRKSRQLFRPFFQGLLKASPLLVVGALGGTIFWGIRENLYADPGFLIQTVKVVPAETLSYAKTKELEKLCLRRNLFKISPQEVARKVEEDPGIREARVTREFPGTLRVELVDRSVFGEIQLLPSGRYYALAEDGMILSEGTAHDRELLLIEILNAKLSSLQRGKKYIFPGFKEAVALTRNFRSHFLARSETLSKIRLDSLGNVSVFLVDGPELRFGRDPSKKLYALDSLAPLLKGPERNQIVYIELQYQDLVVKKR